MKAAKHTPGPWAIGAGGWSAGFNGSGPDGGWIDAMRPTGRYIKRGDEYVPEPPSNGTRICDFRTSGLPKGEGSANARLIAAAPDFFEYVQSRADNGCATAKALIKRVSA